jgi:hypothetical protein
MNTKSKSLGWKGYVAIIFLIPVAFWLYLRLQTPRTPTHFAGSNYVDGLVTEYHPKCSARSGSFTVVLSGVEYKVDGLTGPFAVPIKPGYYQVNTQWINKGVLVLLLPGATQQSAANPTSVIDAAAKQFGGTIIGEEDGGDSPTDVSGYITSERFASKH